MKTEEPTNKRIRKAQEEGNSPLSTFASQSVAFLGTVAIAPAAIGALVVSSSAMMREAITRAGDPAPSIAFDPLVVATAVLALSAPIVGVAALAGGVTSLVQTGGVIATKKIGFNLTKLNPIEGFKQLFSLQRVITILRAFVCGAAVAYFAYDALRTHAAAIANTVGRIDAAIIVAQIIATDLAKKAAMITLALAVLDIVIVRRSWRKGLMMSKDEVKREHKESEGDPQQKAARERAHHEMLASTTIGNVKNASVVVVNPTHVACALRYNEDEGDEAPVMIASGRGELARKMIEAAHHYNVPVLRDVPLARALVELEVGDEIPEELYEAVAEILRAAMDESEAT